MRLEEHIKQLDPTQLADQNLDDINGFLVKIQRNPDQYSDVVAFLLKVFLKEYEKVKASPGEKNAQFYKLLDFFGHVFEYYEADLKFLAESCEDLLRSFPEQLDKDLRFKLAYTLVQLAKKGYCKELAAIKFFMDLLAIKDKDIRSLIFKTAIQLTEKIDKHGKKSSVHKELLDRLTERSRDADFRYVKCVYKMLIVPIKKQIWRDVKAANLIAEGTYHDNQDIVLLCCRFFIENVDNQELEMSSDEEETRKKTLKAGRQAKYSMEHKIKPRAMKIRWTNLEKKSRKFKVQTLEKKTPIFCLLS